MTSRSKVLERTFLVGWCAVCKTPSRPFYASRPDRCKGCLAIETARRLRQLNAFAGQAKSAEDRRRWQAAARKLAESTKILKEEENPPSIWRGSGNSYRAPREVVRKTAPYNDIAARKVHARDLARVEMGLDEPELAFVNIGVSMARADTARRIQTRRIIR